MGDEAAKKTALENHLKENWRMAHDIWPNVSPIVGESGVMGVVSNVTNSTQTLANITGLSFNAEANKIYAFKFFLKGGTTAATCAPWFQFTGPASPGPFYARVSLLEVGTAYPLISEVTAFNALTAHVSFQAGSDAGIFIDGHLVNGANSGTVQLQFRCEVAGQTVTIYAGSSGDWKKLN